MSAGSNIISFEIKSEKKNEKNKSFNFLNNLSLIKISNNLGDNKSLITHPHTTTHHRLTDVEKKELGITKNLIRLSVGLEDKTDIISDIKYALTKSNK